MSGETRKVIIEEASDVSGASQRVEAVNAVTVGGTKSTGYVPTVQADDSVEWAAGGGAGASIDMLDIWTFGG